MIKGTGLEDGDIVFVDLASDESEHLCAENVKCKFVNGLFQDIEDNRVYGSNVVEYRRTKL